jgi:AraC-like DNA-binding protein
MTRLNETRMSAVLGERVGGTFTSCVIAVPHASHATTVIVGLDEDVSVGPVRGRAVIVPPHVVHRTHCAGPAVSFTFDPELAPRIAGLARELGTVALEPKLAGPVYAAAASLARPGVLRGVGDEVACLLERHASAGVDRRIDRRVARVAESLREGEIDPACLAAARLSPAHLRALFVRDIGVPIRTYALWRRLLHALARIGPCDYTTAAHAAGFADLAHFSRTCRRMLGYAPSQLQARLVGAG